MNAADGAQGGHPASRNAYGARAAEYAELFGTMATVADEDRLLVETWAHRVGGSLGDVGCGPGHWTAHLHSLGHDATGIEPVQEFVAHAHRVHPQVRVEPGSFQTLPAAAFDGILAWYSIIHTPPPEVPLLLRHAHRALRPGGSLLLGFFSGDRLEPFEHAVTTAWSWPPTELMRLLTAAGFAVSDGGTRQDPGARRHGWIEAAHASTGQDRPGTTLPSHPTP